MEVLMTENLPEYRSTGGYPILIPIDATRDQISLKRWTESGTKWPQLLPPTSVMNTISLLCSNYQNKLTEYDKLFVPQWQMV